MNPIGSINAVSRIGMSAATGGVGGVGSVGGIDATAATGATSSIGGADAAAQSGTSFLDNLGQAFGQLNTQLTQADSSMADFAAGGNADLHTVMLQMEEASIGLKLGVQVRDKLIEAYQEIMRTQL